jgi:hypothetical protein
VAVSDIPAACGHGERRKKEEKASKSHGIISCTIDRFAPTFVGNAEISGRAPADLYVILRRPEGRACRICSNEGVEIFLQGRASLFLGLAVLDGGEHHRQRALRRGQRAAGRLDERAQQGFGSSPPSACAMAISAEVVS